MGIPPTLTGSRVRLRAPGAADAEAVFETTASDPEVTRYLAWTTHTDVDQTRHVLTDVFNAGDDPTWVIELSATGEVIGTSGWTRPQRHVAEIGYCLGRRWWRQGIMTEVARLMIDEAQRDPTVYRIAGYCHVDNAASAGVLQRSGLQLEGRLVRYSIFPNLGPDPRDCSMYAKAVK